MGKAGRLEADPHLSEQERADLEHLVRRGRAHRDLSLGARLILACAEGVSNEAFAENHRTTPHTVGKWRQRIVELRLD